MTGHARQLQKEAHSPIGTEENRENISADIVYNQVELPETKQ
jgi:hypothetical protein